jgi:hypothetical protein
MAYTALPNMPGIRIKAKAQAPIAKRAPHHGENEVILARKSDLVETSLSGLVEQVLVIFLSFVL